MLVGDGALVAITTGDPARAARPIGPVPGLRFTTAWTARPRHEYITSLTGVWRSRCNGAGSRRTYHRPPAKETQAMTATPSSAPGDPRSRRPTGGASPQQKSRRRHVMRWTVRGVLAVTEACRLRRSSVRGGGGCSCPGLGRVGGWFSVAVRLAAGEWPGSVRRVIGHPASGRPGGGGNRSCAATDTGGPRPHGWSGPGRPVRQQRVRRQ